MVLSDMRGTIVVLSDMRGIVVVLSDIRGDTVVLSDIIGIVVVLSWCRVLATIPLVFHVYLQLLVIHTDRVLWGSAPPQNIGMLYTARHGTWHGDHTDLEQEYMTVTGDKWCDRLA